jgi:hypothetical protein
MSTDETQKKNGENIFSLQPLTQQITGATLEVHNIPGFGFFEKVYQGRCRLNTNTYSFDSNLCFICSICG